MYEIWLALNIAWEIAWGLWPWLLAAGVLWAALLALALKRGWPAWRQTLPLALSVSGLLGILAFVVFRDSSPGAAQDTGGPGPGFIGQSDDQHQAQGGWLSNFLDGPGHGGGDGGGGHGGGHGGGGDGGGG